MHRRPWRNGRIHGRTVHGKRLPQVNGQVATCAGPGEKAFTLEAREQTVDLGMGIKFAAWTYNGAFPGPVLEACEGDTVMTYFAWEWM